MAAIVRDICSMRFFSKLMPTSNHRFFSSFFGTCSKIFTPSILGIARLNFPLARALFARVKRIKRARSSRKKFVITKIYGSYNNAKYLLRRRRNFGTNTS